MGSMLPYIAYMDPMGNKTHGHLLPPPQKKNKTSWPFSATLLREGDFVLLRAVICMMFFLAPIIYWIYDFCISTRKSGHDYDPNVWRVQKIPKCQGMVNHWGIHQKNFTMEVSISPNLWRVQKIPQSRHVASMVNFDDFQRCRSSSPPPRVRARSTPRPRPRPPRHPLRRSCCGWAKDPWGYWERYVQCEAPKICLLV